MSLFQSKSPANRAEELCSPSQVPCAQCGQPIERPEWSEPGDRRMSFLWRCAACDYRFTTIAVFAAAEAVEPERRRIAA